MPAPDHPVASLLDEWERSDRRWLEFSVQKRFSPVEPGEENETLRPVFLNLLLQQPAATFELARRKATFGLRPSQGASG
jgi:hypothetical protein